MHNWNFTVGSIQSYLDNEHVIMRLHKDLNFQVGLSRLKREKEAIIQTHSVNEGHWRFSSNIEPQKKPRIK